MRIKKFAFWSTTLLFAAIMLSVAALAARCSFWNLENESGEVQIQSGASAKGAHS